MSNVDIAKYGDDIGVSYLAGYIILSYVVSTMGCATTLELLHRRTSGSGLYNWYLLLTSSVTMGGIGIWCMHFIGNRAIVLGDGLPSIQILYSVTFTGISFILPVVVLLVAFYAIGTSEKAGYLRIFMGGLLTGSSVCGMHYVGQLGIANYRCTYHPANVVGAAIIAVFASTTALTVFFRWRATWTDSWWRRGLCGCILAVAVSGMHWTAAVGTMYKDYNPAIRRGAQLSRSQTVIICAVLACVACGVLSQLVLTCAFFDSEGRIMVTPHALLPSRKIVDRYIGRTFNDDDLTRTHPAFLWAFRASRNWPLVKDLIPFMRTRIESDQTMMQHYVSKGVVSDQDTELQPDFDDIFKRHFCVAAQELADEVRQPLPDLGMLYDDVLATSAPYSRFSRAMGYSRLRAGKGQLLFTVRQLKKQEASRLASAGFRFTSIENVTDILSRRIHVPTSCLGVHLRDMRDYATSGRNFESGVHLISFVMRPTIHDHFEVLTAKGTGNPLPSSTLLTQQRLQIQHLELITHMEGWAISTCLNWLKSDAALLYKDLDEFREQLVRAMMKLSSSLPTDVSAASKFSARPLIAPCRSPDMPARQDCILLPFCAVASLDTKVSNPDYTFTPLRLFRVQQQVNDGISDSGGFAKEINQELFYSNVLSSTDTATDSDPTSPTRSKFRFWQKKNPMNGVRTVSQESLTNKRMPEIMVRREVKVDVSKLAEPAVKSSMGSTSSHTTVTAGEMASHTYVDELYNLCYSPGVRLRPDPEYLRALSLT
ncbi:uncharacterized protein ATNIH1004_001377 [Aspergillus tanneri]|uniref:MHYT domain-containing protein n=1 Tax=Aspergillus tanneri TaxID=1220188 RepID=A0A5M9N5D7_9EURO|nr:uncharacterized protein ATNIH1004_001377 [Aspergillus tanneri]KAA8652473.1 hypothetical protein ATNIH1004_001377 [Aspergillus tanneri]